MYLNFNETFSNILHLSYSVRAFKGSGTKSINHLSNIRDGQGTSVGSKDGILSHVFLNLLHHTVLQGQVLENSLNNHVNLNRNIITIALTNIKPTNQVILLYTDNYDHYQVKIYVSSVFQVQEYAGTYS